MEVIVCTNPYRDAGLEKAREVIRITEEYQAKYSVCLPFEPEIAVEIPADITLASLEEKISLAVENLKSSDNKLKIIEELNLLLDERNRKCKILK